MTTMAVHTWPGPVPAPQDGRFVICIHTQDAHGTRGSGAPGAQRAAARAQIRRATQEALAALLGISIDDIRIASTPGKPPAITLAGGNRKIGCSFAHEDGYALAAINLDGAIGVDLMRVQDIPDWQAVARDYLGPAATAALQATPAGDRPRAFAFAWTRREAALKCHGQQLAEWRAGDNAPAIALALPVTDLVGHVTIGE